ncbi:hypothetical protein Xen7305DRAFT_00046620 [Xenococcus sp. PCC 7305]|nr:hypothetical protein Xen7305DRAFT_00046620 [Xenococcus sp. PCC 7305]
MSNQVKDYSPSLVRCAICDKIMDQHLSSEQTSYSHCKKCNFYYYRNGELDFSYLVPKDIVDIEE